MVLMIEAHESQGMDLDKASEMIIKSIEANKREAYIVPRISFPKIALYISRYFPGLGLLLLVIIMKRIMADY